MVKNRYYKHGFMLTFIVAYFFIVFFLFRVNYAEFIKPCPFYQDFQKWWELIPSDSPATFFRLNQAIIQYDESFRYNQKNTYHWIEYAKFAITLAQKEKSEQDRKKWLVLAKQAYMKASSLNPLLGGHYEKIANLSRELQEHETADVYFTLALLFHPNRSTFIKRIQQYWQTRWQETRQDIHFRLLQYSFRCLNSFSWKKYGEETVQFLDKENITDVEKWFPSDDLAQLYFTELFLRRNRYDIANKILGKISSIDEKVCRLKNCLLAYQDMLQGNFAQALEYQKTAMNMSQNKFEKQETLSYIFQNMLRHDHFLLIIEWLELQQWDSIENLLLFYKIAVETNHDQEALTGLKNLHQRILLQKTSHIEHLGEAYFLMSQASLHLGQLQQARTYAEQMISSRPDNGIYAMYYCQLLFTLGLDDKIVQYLRAYYLRIENIENIYRWLAEQNFAKGRFRQSRYWILQHLSLVPDSPDLRTALKKIPKD